MTDRLKDRLRKHPWQNGLALWLIGALTVAMLPLGLISVYQTSQVLKESRRLSGVALMDRTQRAAARTQALIQGAFGAAHAVAAANVLFGDGQMSCDAVLERLVAETDAFAFAGFIDTAGTITCSSSGDHPNLAEDAYFLGLLRDPQPRVETRMNHDLPGPRVVRVSAPVYDTDGLRGFVLIAIPYAAAYYTLDDQGQSVDLVVFDREGEFLTAEAANRPQANAPGDFEAILPFARTLEDLAGQGRQSFRGRNRLGETRDFAVVPVIEQRVFALGSWAPQRSSLLPSAGRAMALYFPILMWGAGIVVAYFAVHRLVIRHIRRLQSWMRLYASGTMDFESAQLDRAPEELEVVAEAFRSMTRRLAEQDQTLAEDLAEKTTLLKEVHHRVKNNLQIITSIMNMQIRNARSPEARALLRRVQDRVMALAAIHRYLYLARKLSMVRADRLLDDIIGQLVVMGDIETAGSRVRIATRFDPVEISPDQSVPLSLLAAEAAFNAVKYCATPPDGPAWITLALQHLDDGRICLSVVNSRADTQEEETEGSGLGQQLIASFATQLDGTLEIESKPDRYELHVTFTPSVPTQDEAEDDAPARTATAG
ncbi:sensor histidine kinase [Rhodovulum euryhalinum]|uniref:histidine kinase n=1 Tax=Rhodovulum euryhalinum TaxID=35805 RepID=A0A4R2K863_9RHOB|nr:sensor histidine kinase [Rhodovulum euryhalinum]TCO69551.1 two-component sensor histidine kinase [Rhodovulum euryhalinum]